MAAAMASRAAGSGTLPGGKRVRTLCRSISISGRQPLLAITVMRASKGCLPEMVEDLRSVLALSPPDGVPEPAVREAIAAAICTGYAADVITNQWDDFKTLLAGLPPSPAGRSVLRSIATGLFRLAKGYPGPAPLRWLRLKQASLVAIYSLPL